MAFTDNCDLYAAIHEEGVNRIVTHIMRQRPSLFNYATAAVAEDKTLWCSMVDVTRDVKRHNDPFFKVVDPLPILGSDSPPIQLNFCAQLKEASVDFHPENIVKLQNELNPPIKEQHFSLKLTICATIHCPSDDVIRRIPPPLGEKHQVPPVIVPGKPNCFCLDVFVVGHFGLIDTARGPAISGWVDDLDIVDIKPEQLEENLICYLRTTINVLFRQKLFILLEKLSLDFALFQNAHIILHPTPNPPIPNNPAIEDDQLKAFVSMEVV
jgi:hypothetical protein